MTDAQALELLNDVQQERVQERLREELDDARSQIVVARDRLARAETEHEAAVAAEDAAWALYSPHEGRGTLTEQDTRVEWERAAQTAERASVVYFRSFDRVRWLEKKIAELADPETLATRLRARAENVAKFSKLKDPDRASTGAHHPAPVNGRPDPPATETGGHQMAVKTRTRRKTTQRRATARPARAAASATRKKQTQQAEPRTRSTRRGKASTNAVAHEILTKAGKAMPMKEIVAKVLADSRVKLRTKTPEASVSQAIYIAAKQGRLFKVVERGVIQAIPAKK